MIASLAIGPQLSATVRQGRIQIEGNVHAGEVSMDSASATPTSKYSTGDEAQMLRSQLAAYERVIQDMQKKMEAMEKETAQLRKQISDQKNQK